MSVKRSAYAAHITASLLLSTAIILGACSKKDSGPSADESTAAEALGLKGPSDKAFAKHFAVPNRKVSDSEAKQALTLLNLKETSGSALSWKETSGKAGNYIYSGLSAKNDDSTLKIKNAELIGVHMEGEFASFDRAELRGITIFDEEDNVTVTMDTLSIARPTPAMAKAIFKGLQNVKGVEGLDLNLNGDDGGASFGALGMSGIRMTSDDINLTTKAVIWGEDEKTNLADFKIEGVNLNGKSKKDVAFTVTLDSLSGTGFKTNLFDNMPKDVGSPMSMMGGMNPLAKAYNTIKMSGLNIDSDFASLSLKELEGIASEKGGVTTQREVSGPLIIKLKEAPEDAQAKQAFDLIKSLEFDELVFQHSQTSVLDVNKDIMSVEDGLFTMKDGFKLSYNYGMTGVKAMTDILNTEDGNGSNLNFEDTLEALQFNGFQLRLEDNSIVERGLNLAAQMRGGTPERVKKELKAALTLAPLMAGGGIEGEMITEMSSAFSDFIQNGGTLSIVMNPDAPILASDIANYKGSDMSLKDLGFSAKAE